MKLANYFFIYIIWLLLSSCEKNEIVHNNDHMVHCVLVEGEAPKVIVSNTLKAFPTYPFEIIYYSEVYDFNTNVTMETGSSVHDDFFKESWYIGDQNKTNPPKANDYLSYFTSDDLSPQPNETYNLKVDFYKQRYYDPTYTNGDYSSDDLVKTLTATTTIPELLNFNFDKLENAVVSYDGGYMDTVQVFQLTFNDNGGNSDYYYLLTYMVRVPQFMNVEDVNVDSLWDAQKYRHVSFQYEYDENKPELLPYYQTSQVDILGLANYDKYSLQLNGILFNDDRFNGQEKNIILRGVSQYYQSSETDKMYMFAELHHVSESYYRYYNTLLQQTKTRNNKYTEPVQLYTNIENGLGLFAGVSIQTRYVELLPE